MSSLNNIRTFIQDIQTAIQKIPTTCVEVGGECYAHFEDIDTIIFDFESQFNIEEFQQAYSHVYYDDNLLCVCKLIFLKILLTAAANAHTCSLPASSYDMEFLRNFVNILMTFLESVNCRYIIYNFFSSRFDFILNFSKYFKCLLLHSHDYGYFNFSSESD